MANKYWSDLHLGHERMLEMAQAGVNGELSKRARFEDISEMNDYIIRQWNEHVDLDDDVWIVGDFSYRSRIAVGMCLARLSGHKHLIKKQTISRFSMQPFRIPRDYLSDYLGN